MKNCEYGFPKLGTMVIERGVNFGIYSKNAKEVSLTIYKSAIEKEPLHTYKLSEKFNKTGDIWHIFLNECKEGDIYIWEVDGHTILDPYALSFTKDKLCKEKKNIVVKRDEFSFEKHIKNTWGDTIIYETHIGLFTKNPNSNVYNLGKFKGFKEKIPYLKDLGITAVEFLPIYEWDEYTGRYNEKNQLLENVWGYNPINFFALTKKYCSSSDNSYSEIIEFKELVQELHNNGIELILDVVYNHTAESGENGYIYNFKALNKDEFYMFNYETKDYLNLSGCGNTFSCNRKISKDMIIDSLKYWYSEIGVDGFRFDLASILGKDEYGQWLEYSILDDIAQDPILSYAKLISESWDISEYHLGDMPDGWSEWNGRYRDVVRKFIKGDFGQVPEILKCIFGSSDIFNKNRCNPFKSINFVTCHDGFTLNDLVSYNNKHNLDNGENNRDGENFNNSYNWGEEGETKNIGILTLRKQQMKNFLLILFISQGVPMLLMGDEMGRTQYGNNNAYCQDNITTWVDWSLLDKNRDIFKFTQSMIALRKKYSIFRSERYLESDGTSNGDIILHGVKTYEPDLNYHSLSIAFELYDKESKVVFYIALNSYYNDLVFTLPIDKKSPWKLLIDTSCDKLNFKDELVGESYKVKARSSIILIRDLID